MDRSLPVQSFVFPSFIALLHCVASLEDPLRFVYWKTFSNRAPWYLIAEDVASSMAPSPLSVECLMRCGWLRVHGEWKAMTITLICITSGAERWVKVSYKVVGAPSTKGVMRWGIGFSVTQFWFFPWPTYPLRPIV